MKRMDSSGGTRLSATALALVTACFASLAFAACSNETDDGFVLTPPDDDGETNPDDDGEGGSPSEGGAPSTGGSTPGVGAQAFFIEQVYPSIANAADPTACSACHGDIPTAGAPQFLAGTASAAYNLITGYTPSFLALPDNSNLVQHGAHTGPAFTAAQESLVSEWLMMEVEERGLVGGEEEPPPGKTLAEAMDEFAACMDLTLWSTTMQNMPKQQTANAGQCSGCHTSGDGGAFLSLNVEESFSMNQQFPYVRRLVTGTVDANGAFADLLPSMRFLNKGLEAQGCNPDLENCHPVYNLSPLVKEGYETFVNTTLENWHNGTCGAPPPPDP